MSNLFEAGRDLRNASRQVWLAFLGGQPEALREIAKIDQEFAVIEGLGVHREDALKMAKTCAALGLTPDCIEDMARYWATRPSEDE